VSGRPASIAGEFARRAARYDVLLLAIVPAVLLGVFTLPYGVRRQFALQYSDPSVVSLYVANFTHFSRSHLISNLVGYALVAPTAYLLCTLAEYRDTFWGVFAVFVLVFPVVLSMLIVGLFRGRTGVAIGFSGVLAAFFGFLPIALLWYLRRRFTEALVLQQAPLLYFVGIGTITLIAAPLDRLSYLVLGISAVGLALLGRQLFVDLSRLTVANLRRSFFPPGYAELASVGILLFFAFPFAAFPSVRVTGSSFTNLYVHLVGYSLGYLVPYVTFAVVARE
jgi:hypothetical protein